MSWDAFLSINQELSFLLSLQTGPIRHQDAAGWIYGQVPSEELSKFRTNTLSLEKYRQISIRNCVRHLVVYKLCVAWASGINMYLRAGCL